jgi:hypothetical protein
MFRSVLVGIGAGFLGLCAAAATPVIVAILGAMGGATVIVGLGAFRAIRKQQRQHPSPGEAPRP